MAKHQPKIFEIEPRTKHGINTDLRPKERGCGQRPSRSASRSGATQLCPKRSCLGACCDWCCAQSRAPKSLPRLRKHSTIVVRIERGVEADHGSAGASVLRTVSIRRREAPAEPHLRPSAAFINTLLQLGVRKWS